MLRNSKNRGSFDRLGRRIRLAGVNPNSAAIRIMISACLLAIETYGDCNGYPHRDWSASADRAGTPGRARTLRGTAPAIEVRRRNRLGRRFGTEGYLGSAASRLRRYPADVRCHRRSHHDDTQPARSDSRSRCPRLRARRRRGRTALVLWIATRTPARDRSGMLVQRWAGYAHRREGTRDDRDYAARSDTHGIGWTFRPNRRTSPLSMGHCDGPPNARRCLERRRGRGAGPTVGESQTTNKPNRPQKSPKPPRFIQITEIGVEYGLPRFDRRAQWRITDTPNLAVTTRYSNSSDVNKIAPSRVCDNRSLIPRSRGYLLEPETARETGRARQCGRI